MKSIIIVADRMVTGGIEKALISMLNNIDYKKYNVTLLLTEKSGNLLSEVPREVTIITYPDTNLLEYLKSFKFIKALKYCYFAVLIKYTKNLCKKYIYSCKISEKLNREYDIAISYYMPISRQVVYVCNNIKAKHKYAWMHCDPLRTGDEIKQFEKIYMKYDKIFCVSKDLVENTKMIFKGLGDKVEVFYNLIDKKKIKSLSKSDDLYLNYDGIKILTVGRLSPEKQQDMIIPIVKKFLENNYNIRWYCIGEGILKEKLIKDIKDNNLSDNIILLGSKENPYPYIRQCDIYAQLSRHEGYCLSLAEARCLEKPIVSTNFSGVREQIIDKQTGIIVENDWIAVYEAIKGLIDDKELREKLINSLKNECVNTNNQINKLLIK